MKTTHYDALRHTGHSVSTHTVTHDAHFIGIVVFDGFSMLSAAEVVDVFDKANQVSAAGPGGLPCYRTAFISSRGGCVSSSAQIDVMTQTAGQLTSARALFIACGEVPADLKTEVRFSDWLRDAARQVDDVIPIGNGEKVLSAIGVSAKRLAIGTDIAGPEELPHHGSAGRHPRSGQAARFAVRQALDLVRQDFGIGVLRRVLELIPDPGLAEFNAIANDGAKSIKEKIRESAQWIRRNCSKAISVTVAAQTAGMSDRSYLRHFRAEMGVKPSEHLRRSRVELAAAMLESSDLPVDKIARRCGLTSGECLARLFRQIMNISPTEYRGQLRSSSTKAYRHTQFERHRPI